MSPTTGNQHQSRKVDLLRALSVARAQLGHAQFHRGNGNDGLADYHLSDARHMLTVYRAKYDAAPASTRRRWACGK
jgi:hypothetical protein